MGITIIAYVVPSKTPVTLLLSSGVAQSYYLLIAENGRTIDEFHTYCEGSRLQRLVNDVEERRQEYVGMAGRDALRKKVTEKLLNLLSTFRY